MIVAIVPANLVTNSLLFLFCPFVETKNKNQQVGDLVKRNISVFSLQRVSLFFRVVPNSIEFFRWSQN